MYYRIGAIAVVSLWIAALCAPYDIAPFYGQPSEAGGSGYHLAIFGWLGPLAASVAWYANLPLAYCMVKMLHGRSPGRKIALIACGLAYTALLPHFLWNFETDGRFHSEVISGMAVWLWLAAFTVTAGFGLLPNTAAVLPQDRLDQPRPQSCSNR